MKYKTAYFCGNAKTPAAMANISNGNNLILGLLIELETGKVLDVSVTLITELAQSVVGSYLAGKNLVTDAMPEMPTKRRERYVNELGLTDYDAMVEEISFRHVGNATKPIIKALTDIRRNYLEYMQVNGPYLRGETDKRPEW